MDSTNIYEDLKDQPLDEKILKLEETNLKLVDHIKQLENDIGKLCNELTQMKDREGTLKRNISELYKTAKLENERNQRRIAELQDEVDGLRFRRRPNLNVDRKRPRDNEFERKSEDRGYRNREKSSRSLDRIPDRFRSERERGDSVDRRRSRDRDYYHHKPGRRPERGRRFIDVRTDRYVKPNRAISELKEEVKSERVTNIKQERVSVKDEHRKLDSPPREEFKVKCEALMLKDEVKREGEVHVDDVVVNANASKRRRCVIKMVN